MDNAMVKRGIGAVVLAIIAALLLGYLLKDKSRERQEVVEMKLPGAPEMNIPSLTGTDESTTPATLVDEGKTKLADTVKGAGATVVAAATGTATALKDTVSNTATPPPSTTKPGFAIRPPKQNEQREIVDSNALAMNSAPAKSSASANTQTTDGSASIETQPKDTVVASSSNTVKKPATSFKPRIVEEKKKPAKKPTQVKKPETRVSKTQEAKPKKPASPVVAGSAVSGKYSIQLLATSSQSRANKLAKTMKNEGYTSFITQTTNNNKVLFRVRIGGHNERSAALKAQENMKRRYRKNFFVQNSLVVSN